MNEIQIGDTIHARLYSADRSQVMVQNFTVTEIEGNIYRGGVQDCDTDAGWELELLYKSLENLNLPEVLSEITVQTRFGKKLHLTGKSKNWRDNDGNLIAISDILTWENGHV